MLQSPCRCLDWPTTLILRIFPPMRKAKKKQSVRDQNRLLPFPFQADSHTSMMRLWESLKWILGNPRETEGFDEGLDLEYHDATENPCVLEPVEPMQKSVLSHGGCGSSSLRECIELLNNTERNAPATLHSRVKMENTSDPLQFFPHFPGEARNGSLVRDCKFSFCAHPLPKRFALKLQYRN